MLARIDAELLPAISNKAMRSYAQGLIDVQGDFRSQVEAFGLPFASVRESVPRIGDACGYEACVRLLANEGVSIDNGDRSLCSGFISPSCIACRRGVNTATFLISTQCPRNCWFCFNPNQENHELLQHRENDVLGELDAYARAGLELRHIALTGGEPLMHAATALRFFARARELYPSARLRLYTSGAYLDSGLLDRLAQAGLDEIRFSVKLDDPASARMRLLCLIDAARGHIPSVMVEMPVGPADETPMKELLLELEAIQVDGMNLLELCFPLTNASEFARRGLRLKNPPYRTLYNWWYAGGLPIAGSEQVCLSLLLFAVERGLRMGVHYCSLENKLTGQVYQQNFKYPADGIRCFSPSDYFLKSAKAFGADARLLRACFEQMGVSGYAVDERAGFVEYHPRLIPLAARAFPEMETALCSHVAEWEGGMPRLREVGMALFAPGDFDRLADL